MQQPGNTWLEVWQLAEPLAVHRQKKLFDYTTEAEKVVIHNNSQLLSWLHTAGIALYGITKDSGSLTTNATSTVTNVSG